MIPSHETPSCASRDSVWGSYSDNVAVSTLADWLDRAVMALVDHVPGWAIAALALVFYPGLGLFLPLALNWRSAWLIDANVIGVCGAAVLSLGWFAAQVEAAKRRHLIEWTTEFRHLDAEEFEWLVGEMFRREGWKVEETGGHGTPDRQHRPSARSSR